MVIYIGFLVTYAFMMSEYMQAHSVDMRSYMTEKLSGRTGAQHTLDNVTSVESFYDYLFYTLLPSVYGNEIAGTESESESNPAIDSLSANRMIGDGLVLTSRVSLDAKCRIGSPFTDVFGHCFSGSDAIDNQNRDQTTYGVGNVYTWTNSGVPSSTVPSLSGSSSLYTTASGGYVVPLSTNYTSALLAVSSMKSNGFVESDNNRVILIFHSFFNTNLNMYIYTQIQFAISASNEWTSSLVINTATDAQISPFDSTSFLALYVALAMFLVYFVLLECYFLYYALHRSEHAKSRWLGYVVIVLLLVQLVVTVTIQAPAYVTGSTYQVMDAWKFVKVTQSLIAVMAVNAVCISLWAFGISQIDTGVLKSVLFFLLFLVFFSVAFQLASSRESTFSDALYFTSLSLIGTANWEELDTSPIECFLTILFFVVLHAVFLCGIGAHILSLTLDVCEGFTREFDRYHILLMRSLSSRVSKPMDRFLQSHKSQIKQYLPGYYYKVVVPDKKFEESVLDLELQEKRLRRQTVLDTIATVQPAEEGEDKETDGMLALRTAVDDVKFRLNDVGCEVENESRNLIERLQELNAILLVVGRKIS